MAGCARESQRTDMDTIDTMVVPGIDESSQPPPRRLLRWLVPVALVSILLLGALELSLPYYAIAPGSAREVNDLISVPRDRSFPPAGKVLLATVSLRRVSALGALEGWLDPDVDVVPEERVLGSTPPKQFTKQNLQLMDDSKQVAVVVALRRLGFAVPEHGKGALVVSVEKGTPAEGRLAQGDVITAVDGRPTPLSQQTVEAIRARRPGQVARLEILGTNGATRVEEIVLASRPKEQTGFLGVLLRTKEQRFEYPFDVAIDSGTIGGPSAGLAFTLGVLDSLTNGELTGERKVAATGTIEIDGTVGEVGGVAQKTAAVRAAGAQYFLVPVGEYTEATAHAGRNLAVVKVANLDDAIAALARLGGDVSALGPAPPGRRG